MSPSEQPPPPRPAAADVSYVFGGFELQVGERRLHAGAAPVHLGSRSFDLLLALVERGNRLVTMATLLEQVWPGLVVGENNVQAHVSALRKVLGPAAIETVTGHGYRFTLPIETRRGVAAAPPAEPAAPAVTPPPPPAAATASPPTRLRPLLGRDDEIATLHRLMSESRVVTVVGAGGIGKTSLAQAVIQAKRADFEHGIAWVELARLTDAEQLPYQLAGALGVAVSEQGVTDKHLFRELRNQSRLIVLDNAEHLRQGVADLIGALCGASDRLHFLVTSQTRLQIADEQVFRLAPLPFPDQPLPPEAALGYGAVALFVSRAQALNQSFALNERNTPAVLDICRRLDGIPLALELAAARVPALGVAGLAERLDERFRLLNTGNRNAPTRQQTLAATMEWSYRLLGVEEQRVFRQLGGFLGSFDLEDVIAVVQTDGLDEYGLIALLGELVERSLVAVDHGDPPSYRLLESPRMFALAELERMQEADALRRRHIAHYRRHAEAIYAALDTPDWPARCEWIDQHYGNLYTALDAALNHELDPLGGTLIALALGRYWQERAHLAESRQWLLLAYLHQEELSDPLRARLLYQVGSHWISTGSFTLGVEPLTESYELFSRLPEHRREWAMAGNDLGVVKFYLGHYEEANALYTSVLPIHRSIGNRPVEADTLANIAYCYLATNQFELAQEHARQVLPLVQGDNFRLAYTQGLLGNCAFELGDAEGAIEYERQEIEILIRYGEGSSLAMAQQRLAKYLWSLGRRTEARSAMAEALTVFANAPHPTLLGYCLDTCTGFAISMAQWDTAAQLAGFAQDWFARNQAYRAPVRQRQLDALLPQLIAQRSPLEQDPGYRHGATLTLAQGLALARSMLDAIDEAAAGAPAAGDPATGAPESGGPTTGGRAADRAKGA